MIVPEPTACLTTPSPNLTDGALLEGTKLVNKCLEPVIELPAPESKYHTTSLASTNPFFAHFVLQASRIGPGS